MTSPQVVGHILLGITAFLAVGILWRLLRIVVCIVLLTGLPDLRRGKVPPWLASVAATMVSWFEQCALRAWDILRPILYVSGPSGLLDAAGYVTPFHHVRSHERPHVQDRGGVRPAVRSAIPGWCRRALRARSPGGAR